MSWQILVHSVRQVFGNMNGALRVSGVLFVAQIIVTLTLGRALLLDQAELQQQMTDGSINWPVYLATLVLCCCWGCGLPSAGTGMC